MKAVYSSAFDAFNRLVPCYRSHSHRDFRLSFGWDKSEAAAVRAISPKRADKRVTSYLIPGELERVKERLAEGKSGGVSIRFGHKKEGHGISGKRGDFCLMGGVVVGSKLYVFYRRLDLIGGFLYDLTIFDAVITQLGVKIKTVEIFAVGAQVIALDGNSNQALFHKMQKLIKDRAK